MWWTFKAEELVLDIEVNETWTSEAPWISFSVLLWSFTQLKWIVHCLIYFYACSGVSSCTLETVSSHPKCYHTHTCVCCCQDSHQVWRNEEEWRNTVCNLHMFRHDAVVSVSTTVTVVFVYCRKRCELELVHVGVQSLAFGRWSEVNAWCVVCVSVGDYNELCC